MKEHYASSENFAARGARSTLTAALGQIMAGAEQVHNSDGEISLTTAVAAQMHSYAFFQVLAEIERVLVEG